jgi:hypothetical protein
MNIDQQIVKVSFPVGQLRLLRKHCFGVSLRPLKFPAVMLAVTVALATGCSSTGAGFSARLISPVPTKQPVANLEEDGSYQPARSPEFSDYLGG